MNKETREIIYNKFGGRCAYSGTVLEPNWQCDHFIPKRQFTLNIVSGNPDDISNLMPVQGIINHYKRSLSIKEFKEWYLGGLHERLKSYQKTHVLKKVKNEKNIC